jgi:thiol-disulfide isomerase/thioredoxin
MKFTPLLLSLSLSAASLLKADVLPEPKEKDKPADTAKPAGADAAWAELEKILKGPAERPKSREEAVKVFKELLTAMDEKGEAFLKAYPKDARRWKLKLELAQANQARTFAGMEAKSGEEVTKSLQEILAADDADAETKAFASFLVVMQSEENAEEFVKLAEAHKKAYPDFKGNSQIDGQLKKMEAEKTLKEMPLELSFTSTEGKEIDLTKMRGKVVLIDFWATWCGPCVAEIPSVLGTYKKLHEKGFEIVGISFDQDKDKLEKMTKEKEMPWPQYFDGEGWGNKFGKQYGISSIPTMWLVDKKGMVVDTNARQDLEKKVEKLLAE